MEADTYERRKRKNGVGRGYRAARGRVWEHEWENAREIRRGIQQLE